VRHADDADLILSFEGGELDSIYVLAVSEWKLTSETLDLDFDGFDELIFGSPVDDHLRVYCGDTGHLFLVLSGPGVGELVDVVDANDDGIPDLVLSNYGETIEYLFLGPFGTSGLEHRTTDDADQVVGEIFTDVGDSDFDPRIPIIMFHDLLAEVLYVAPVEIESPRGSRRSARSERGQQANAVIAPPSQDAPADASPSTDGPLQAAAAAADSRHQDARDESRRASAAETAPAAATAPLAAAGAPEVDESRSYDAMSSPTATAPIDRPRPRDRVASPDRHVWEDAEHREPRMTRVPASEISRALPADSHPESPRPPYRPTEQAVLPAAMEHAAPATPTMEADVHPVRPVRRVEHESKVSAHRRGVPRTAATLVAAIAAVGAFRRWRTH
jgi:hypothetical protein